jgi:two-component system, cell cycle sensor histidine kinase and response regulator CckA
VGEHGARGILVVDDDEPLRTMMGEHLRDLGFAVTEAADPVAALEMLKDRSRRVDLVVTDLVMPKMSAPHFVERLRELRPSIRILRVSGYPRHHHPRLAEDVPFLQKPFTLEALEEAVHSALAGGLS